MIRKKRKIEARYGTKKDPQLSLPTEERIVCLCEGAPTEPILIEEAREFRGKDCHKKGLTCCSLLRSDRQD